MPGYVQLWDPSTLRILRELKSVAHSGSVRFTRDGKRLVARFTRESFPSYETRVAVWSTSAPSQESHPERAEPKQPVAESKPALRFRPSTFLSQPETPPPVHSVARTRDSALWLSYGLWVGLNGEPRLFGRYSKIPLDAISVTNSEGDAQTDERILEVLQKPTAVLVSADGEDVHPYYLQTVKPGTLVIVIKGYGWRAEVNSGPDPSPLIKLGGDSPDSTESKR